VYTEEDGTEKTRRRETRGGVLKRHAFRHASACTAYTCVVVNAVVQEGPRQRQKEEEEEEKKATEGDEEGLDVVVSASRETLAARRALPFSRDVVANRRRCGPITRCHRPRREREYTAQGGARKGAGV